MKPKAPRVDEQAAADAISAVVELVEPPEFEPNGRDTAPDWRMRMSDDRVADVEVMWFTDEAERSFFGALTERDGSPRAWPDERLSHRWPVLVLDRSPGDNKKRRPLETLIEELSTTLALVEDCGGTPQQMAKTAQKAIDQPTMFVGRPSPMSLVVTERPGLHLYNNGQPSQNLRVTGVPELVGPGSGCVETYASALESGSGYGEMVSAIRSCITKKTSGGQLDAAPNLRWLAVVLDGIPGFQLSHYFGSESPMSPPELNGITFDYFDAVWAVTRTRIGEDRREGFVVLRLSEGGHKQQHHIVSRS